MLKLSPKPEKRCNPHENKNKINSQRSHLQNEIPNNWIFICIDLFPVSYYFSFFSSSASSASSSSLYLLCLSLSLFHLTVTLVMDSMESQCSVGWLYVYVYAISHIN